MEAFEKWCPVGPNGTEEWRDRKYYMKEGWKAALEWVRDELCPGNGKAEIREDIEKELGENKNENI